jgi:transcriptional regulator with XRE-family HTH domain
MPLSQRVQEIDIRRIGRHVRVLREKAAISQAQLAQKAGLSQRAVRELEAGRTNPSLATVVGVAGALGVGLDELVAAARDSSMAADWTRAAAADAVSVELTRQLPEPRMRARIFRLDEHSGPHPDHPSSAVFGHVLGGAVTVTLDSEETVLRAGDSFHAQAGALRGWSGQGGGRLLVVETADRAAGPRRLRGQTSQ